MVGVSVGEDFSRNGSDDGVVILHAGEVEGAGRVGILLVGRGRAKSWG